MLFNPDLFQNKAWWTFFYNGKLHYLDGSVFSADDENILAREWIQEVKIKADVKDVWNGLFGDLSDSLLQQNAFYQEIQQKDDARRYFELARRSGSVAALPSQWEEDGEQNLRQEQERNSIMRSIAGILNDGTTPFFQKKYAFQLCKLSYYAWDTTLFDRTYNRYFARSSDKRELLDWWAMHYKSMVLERKGKLDSANYLHALVFSHSTNKMLASRQFFSRENLERILALAKNDNDRADIHVLSEVINPGRSLEGIRKVYEYAPDHKHLPLLVTREINKLEDWLGSTRYAEAHTATMRWWDEPTTENWQRDFDYLKELIQAMEGMEALRSAHPEYYDLAMACLNLMEGDAGASAKLLSNIRSTDPEVQYQADVLKVVLTTLQKDITRPEVQDEIGHQYEALILSRGRKFESQKRLYSLSSYLRYVFANKDMVHLAGLFDNYATNKFCYTCKAETFEYSLISYFDRHASTADLHKLIDLYDRPGKNKLEQVLLKPYASKYYFHDLLSAKYLRKGDADNALRALQQVPDSFWASFSNASDNIDSDPFLNNSELLGIQTMTFYNKRELLEKMIQLEQEAERNPSRRNHHYFLLGNAWYNFTANSWFMLSYSWSYNSSSEDEVYKIAFRKAAAYYKQALQYETDDEKKVRLLYMLALLSDSEKRKAYAMEYERYSQTDFYGRKNCLTLRELAQN